MDGLRVAVIGGGLGGLCLAQGLHRAGAEVTVYERDAALGSRPQGYRLHVDARAGLALQQCLPPELFELFLATCGRPGKRFTVLSDRLRVLRETVIDPGRDPFAAATLSTSVNRQTLREILVGGLGQRVRFGHELTGFDAGADGVSLHFAGGGQAEADLLVGADGVSSVVRQRYLPNAQVIDTGGRCIYGRTPLTDAALSLIPPPLLDGFTAIVGKRIGMAAGLVQFRQRPEQAAAALSPGVRLTPAADYLMWGLAAGRQSFPAPDQQLAGLDPAALHDMALTMIRSWHPDLRRLVAMAETGETFLVRIRTSVPEPAWPPSRVTLLGDAIHAMSPARGSGANTALRDAGVLCQTLAGAAPDGPAPDGPAPDGPAPDGQALLAAVGDYEAQMREYGYAEVLASQRAEAEMGARRSVAFWLYRRLARSGRGERPG